MRGYIARAIEIIKAFSSNPLAISIVKYLMASTVNYAYLFGIHSVAAAIVFAAFYVLLFVFFVKKLIARSSYVLVLLCFFCASGCACFLCFP